MLSKSKFITVIFAVFLLLLTPFCYSTDISNTTVSSDEYSETTNNIQYSDLYIENESEYSLKDIISGNAFISVDTFNTDPSASGGIIEGNLYVAASNVNIKSDVIYSETEKDDLGNPQITINSYSTISGSAFIVANKVVIEPGSRIYGDLYICASEVELMRDAIIYGNVFVLADTLNISSEIGGDLYATVNTYNMEYYGFISRDLHLVADNSNINGYVYRNSFIDSNNIVTQDKFINQNGFTITDADNVTFSGEVMGNANINSKNLSFKNTDNGNDLVCQIDGNLSYSTKQEISVPEGVVLGDISYSNYTSSTSTLSIIWMYILNLLELLVFVYIIYLLISKFATKYIDKLSNISGINLLKYLGIGLGFLVAIPLICALLFVIRIGTILGFILLLIYALVFIIAKPIFIVSIATFLKNKLNNKISIYLYILVFSIILFFIGLIPYVKFVVFLLLHLIGIGMIANGILKK